MRFWTETALKAMATVSFGFVALTLTAFYAMTWAAQFWEFGAPYWPLAAFYTLVYAGLSALSLFAYRFVLRSIECWSDGML